MRALWIRSTDAKDLVDTWLLCTVTTILVVRLFLVITGYPQLGGGGLHIAHLLWGGLLMLVGLVLTLTLLTRASRWLAAVVGGIGFGLFIDEVGKFVTANNDYFYRPAYSIMYVTLVVIWLVARRLFDPVSMTRLEASANALDYLKEAGVRPLRESERRRALALLERAQPSPLRDEARALLEHAGVVADRPPGPVTRLAGRVRDWYLGLTRASWFPSLLIAIFVAYTGANLFRAIELLIVVVDSANDPGATLEEVDDAVNGRHLGFSGWAVLGSSLLVVALNVVAILKLVRGQRLAAYRWFERGLLVDILFVQVFDFADLQLAAFGLLAFNLLVLVTLRLMMHAEEHTAHRSRTPREPQTAT